MLSRIQLFNIDKVHFDLCLHFFPLYTLKLYLYVTLNVWLFCDNK